MKFVLFDPYTHGHHLRYASYLIDYLLRDNCDVMFVTRIGPQADWLLEKYPKLVLERINNPALKSAIRLSREWKADVLHILYPTSFLRLPRDLHKRYPFKVFVSDFWLPSLVPLKETGVIRRVSIKMNQFLMLIMLKMKFVSGIIFHSTYPPFTKSLLLSNVSGLDKYLGNVTFLYDGPSDTTWYGICSQIEAQRKLKLPEKNVVLLFFGLLTLGKGIDVLLRSIKDVGRKFNYRLVIAGMPASFTKDRLLRLIELYELSDNVVLRIGHIPESVVPYYFLSADVVILPYNNSYQVGSTGILQQACSAGKPVITTDVGAIGRAVKHYSLGLVVQPESAESLREGIERFLNLYDMSQRAEHVWLRNVLRYAELTNHTSIFQSIIEFYHSVMHNSYSKTD